MTAQADLPGTARWHAPAVLAATVESMVELSSRLRGLLGERTDLPMASLYLRADGPGCCLHGPVAGYDWDGAARAHGALDLMTLRFDLARRARDLGRWVGAGLRESAPRCQG